MIKPANRKYDWMADIDSPKIDFILKFWGLARYRVVKALENDIKILTSINDKNRNSS